MLAAAEQRGRHRQRRLPLQRLDRHTGGDAAVQRNFDDVVSRLRYGLGRGGARWRPGLGTGPFGHPQHLQRAGAIGQATQELTLL